MVSSFKKLFFINSLIFSAFVMTFLSGCSKDQKNISKVLAVTSPMGCLVGAAVGKKLAHNKTKGELAGATVGGTVATIASIATGGVIFAAASSAFNAITKKFFKHNKNKRKNKTTVTV